MTLSIGDKNVIANLKSQYDPGTFDIYSDETIAKAWREFSNSDEYHRRNEEPNLFLEWVEMIHGEA